MRGTPDSWARLGPLPDVMGTVAKDLTATVHRARLAGIDPSRIVIDPESDSGRGKSRIPN